MLARCRFTPESPRRAFEAKRRMPRYFAYRRRARFIARDDRQFGEAGQIIRYGFEQLGEFVNFDRVGQINA